jgi:hypothetical protein
LFSPQIFSKSQNKETELKKGERKRKRKCIEKKREKRAPSLSK